MAHKLGGAHTGVPLCIMQLRPGLALNSVVCPTRSTLGKNWCGKSCAKSIPAGKKAQWAFA